MSIYTIIRINFEDKYLLEIIFWISIVLLQSWLWNWMGHSIMRWQNKNMMHPERNT